MALSAETVNSIIDCAASDPDFVKDLLQDPESAVDARGIELQPGELDELDGLVRAAETAQREGMVEELQARISHSLVGHGDSVSLLLVENFLKSAASEG